MAKSIITVPGTEIINPASLQEPSVPAAYRYRRDMQTEEQRLGQKDFFIPGVSRLQFPEDANADSVLMSPELLHASPILQIPPVIPVDGEFTVLSADYNMLANYQYVKDAAAVLGAAGRNDQSDYPTVAAGGVFTAGAASTSHFSPPNLIIGFQIMWGLSILSWAPFAMKVATQGFRGQHYQPLNRNFTLRMDSAKSGNGGIFQVLFAQRLTYQESCGCGGYAANAPEGASYLALGGMNKAIVQNAVIPGSYGVEDTESAGTLMFPPYSQPSSFGPPTIVITVPAALAAGFTATVQLITAGSPYLASMREALLDKIRDDQQAP